MGSALLDSHIAADSGKALTRLWGRDVMLYTGGVSFFSLLAIFPALAILITLYSLLSDPAQAAREGEILAGVIPPGRGTSSGGAVAAGHAPHVAMSAQGLFALLIGSTLPTAVFKAMLAGLSFIHDEDEPHGFVGFKPDRAGGAWWPPSPCWQSSRPCSLALRVMGSAFDLRPLRGVSWLYSEWTWGQCRHDARHEPDLSLGDVGDDR